MEPESREERSARQAAIREVTRLTEELQRKYSYSSLVAKMLAEGDMLEMVKKGAELMSHQQKLNIDKERKQESIVENVHSGRPMVTRDAYDKAREVLDALPPGVYMKCSACGSWQRDGMITFEFPNRTLCEKCSDNG